MQHNTISWEDLAKGSQHYQDNIKRWVKADDVVRGSDAVKVKGKEYLPAIGTKMKDETQLSNSWGNTTLYEDYIRRALFTNMTHRTVDTYVGSLFMKEPRIEGLEDTETALMLDNIDNKGTSLNEFVRSIAKMTVVTGYAGILTDTPNSIGEMSIKEQKEAGIRPYLISIHGMNLLNVHRTNYNGKMQISFVKIRSTEEELSEDGLDTAVCEYITILDLVEGIYRNRRFKRVKADVQTQEDQAILESVSYPMANGEVQTTIPVKIVGDGSMSIIDDLVDVNLSHYISSANYERVLSNTAFPTATIKMGENGWKDDSEKAEMQQALNDGAYGATFILPTGADFKIHEFSGTDAKEHAASMKHKEESAARLGAYSLMEKSGVEGADAMRIRSGGQMSTLNVISHTISKSIEGILNHINEVYYGRPSKITFKLNDDFIAKTLDPNRINALVSGVQAGKVPLEAVFLELKETNSLLDETDTLEKYKGKLEVKEAVPETPIVIDDKPEEK